MVVFDSLFHFLDKRAMEPSLVFEQIVSSLVDHSLSCLDREKGNRSENNSLKNCMKTFYWQILSLSHQDKNNSNKTVEKAAFAK